MIVSTLASSSQFDQNRIDSKSRSCCCMVRNTISGKTQTIELVKNRDYSILDLCSLLEHPLPKGLSYKFAPAWASIMYEDAAIKGVAYRDGKMVGFLGNKEKVTIDPGKGLQFLKLHSFNQPGFLKFAKKYSSVTNDFTDFRSCHFLRSLTPDDSLFISCLIDIHPHFFRYLSNQVKRNHMICLNAIERCPMILRDLAPSLRDDEEMVRKAVSLDGLLLASASERLRSDKSIVLQAIQNQPSAFKFASIPLQNDKEVTIEAVKGDGFMICYASEEMKANREVVLFAMHQSLFHGLDILRRCPAFAQDQTMNSIALEARRLYFIPYQ